ncbi:MAG: YeeE/YedE family protein [Gammaproteobacteria bacterium]|nr:YeeE/YedE family protein [Gammaproteobacteria bacterium]
MEYWPWWLGAIGLAAVSVLNFLLLGRLLGVSGSWAKVVGWRDNQERSAELKSLAENKSGMDDALLAETLAEFGEASLQELGNESDTEISSSPVITGEQHTPWTVHFVFLFFMFIGGLLAALMSGNFKLELTLSPIHSQIFGADWEVWLALLSGGVMVGFGTQMAGGCTSGHGLSGCARLIPASLVATVTFMLSAMLLSFMMEASLR